MFHTCYWSHCLLFLLLTLTTTWIPLQFVRTFPHGGMCTTVPRAGCYCWVFLLQRSPGCYGTLRETNKGAEQGHGVPTEWRNPTWVKVSRGQAFGELLLEFPMATLRLCGEVTYKMVGDEAICFVLARLAVHVRVVFFLSGRILRLRHICVCCHRSHFVFTAHCL